ncbi:MAG TPA: PIF1 family DEAD/DEAH box helicase [Candidatus Paceibacterota bacterium]|nr:PIF1 family DEAD/DEAH box helicase [Candidatus Paceibacterota bacterium]
MTQETALSILKTGRSVFLTGEPGSGKTHTINQYIPYLKQLKINAAVTASTGIAATHINGMTLHSWSGIGIKKKLSDTDIRKIIKYRGKKIDKTAVLVIDEISMLDASVLDLVDTVCRAVKKSELPFGGVQVVFVGDFFQLPPVRRQDEAPYKFAFESNAWQTANPAVCYLTEQHRQSDSELVGLLSAIRSGDVLDSHYECLDRCLARSPDNQKITKLFPHNADVDKINLEELNKLSGSSVSFVMKSKGNERFVEQLKKGCLSPEELKLKKGAVVMFTKNNFELGYVNGTIGTVIGFDEDEFDEEEALPIVKTREGKKIIVGPAEWIVEENGEAIAKIEQLPLRLAWAMTIHKSQGATLDEAFVDLKGAFVEGQGYVALSRVKALNGFYLNGYNENALKVHPLVSEQDGMFRSKSAEVESEFSLLSGDDLALKHNAFILSADGEFPKENKTSNIKHSHILENMRMNASVKMLESKPSENNPSVGKVYSVEDVRKNYPNAYRPWDEDEDKNLVDHYLTGRSVTEIAATLGRKTGAIRSRLAKLGLTN